MYYLYYNYSIAHNLTYDLNNVALYKHIVSFVIYIYIYIYCIDKSQFEFLLVKILMISVVEFMSDMLQKKETV